MNSSLQHWTRPHLPVVAGLSLVVSLVLQFSATSAWGGMPRSAPPESGAIDISPPSSLPDLFPDKIIRRSETLAPRLASLGRSWHSWRRCETSTVRYFSHTRGGQPVWIFGYYSRPSGATRHSVPGLLILHGAGGYAVRARAEEAAARGYAALAIDLPGQGPGRARSRSSGPDMNVDNIFRVRPSPREAYLYHAIYAARRGLTFLASRPEVDASRLGIYGISWGGVIALLTAATDERVKAVINLFGAGYLLEGSTWLARLQALPASQREQWLQLFDVARYTDRIRCPVLSITGTNDGCYWLPAFAQTQQAMNTASRQLLLPNLNHRINGVGRQAIWAWFRRYLQYGGQPVTTGGCWRSEATGDRVRLVGTLGPHEVVRRIHVHYLLAGQGWAKARWQKASTRRLGECWEAWLPGVGRLCYLFATLECRDGLAISTPIHTFCIVKYPYGTRLLHAPFMTPRRIYGAAEELARQMGGQFVQATEKTAVVNVFGHLQISLPVRWAEGRPYLALRELAEAIGASIFWQKYVAQVTPPPPQVIARRLSQQRLAAATPPANAEMSPTAERPEANGAAPAPGLAFATAAVAGEPATAEKSQDALPPPPRTARESSEASQAMSRTGRDTEEAKHQENKHSSSSNTEASRMPEPQESSKPPVPHTPLVVGRPTALRFVPHEPPKATPRVEEPRREKANIQFHRPPETTETEKSETAAPRRPEPTKPPLGQAPPSKQSGLTRIL